MERNAIALQSCKETHPGRIGEAQRRKVKNYGFISACTGERRAKLIQPGRMQLAFQHEGDVIFGFNSGDS